MSRIGQCVVGLLALGVVVSCAAQAGAQGAKTKPVVPTQKWAGSIEDAALAKEAPKGERIADLKTFEKVWHAWKVGAKVPAIDFGKDLVFVATTSGGRLRHLANLDDKGNLRVGALATRDARPGFRYSIIVVSKEGVKSVNGKALEAKKE